jgi:hypothetical protein
MIEYYMWTASQYTVKKGKKSSEQKFATLAYQFFIFVNTTKKDVSHENLRVLILQSYVHAWLLYVLI